MPRKFKKYQDNEEFVKLFRKKLSELPDEELLELISQGQFQGIGHNCAYVDDHNIDSCDNCYSGDTDHDMSHSNILGDIWIATGKELGLDIRAFVPYEESESDSFGEESSDSCE